MKQAIAFFLSAILLTSCKKDIPEPPTEANSNTTGYASFGEYQVTFFNDNFSGSPIPVSINGSGATITYAYNFNPDCGAIGCANFTVPYGTYTYSYISNSGNTITGTLITGASQCITILIN